MRQQDRDRWTRVLKSKTYRDHRFERRAKEQPQAGEDQFMVKLGWLPLVELYVSDASFVAMLIALAISSRRNKSAPITLLILSVVACLFLRLVEFMWDFSLERGWVGPSSINSLYWTWHSIARTCAGIAFAIGFCWHFLSRRRATG